jgi:hypothetical protein
VVVLFIWSKKEASFDYMPDARVLKNIQSKTLKTSLEVQKTINTFQIDSITLADMIKTGSVDFKKSNTKAEPCKTYWIHTSYKNEKLSLLIENCDSIATIQEIIKN